MSQNFLGLQSGLDWNYGCWMMANFGNREVVTSKDHFRWQNGCQVRHNASQILSVLLDLLVKYVSGGKNAHCPVWIHTVYHTVGLLSLFWLGLIVHYSRVVSLIHTYTGVLLILCFFLKFHCVVLFQWTLLLSWWKLPTLLQPTSVLDVQVVICDVSGMTIFISWLSLSM